ncbi:LysM peptidoglycan-binding domain-containing protein [Candidatus Poriferisocius sp.]|uniref:LysM peptidoglycan-binding domain-containing protein n=1 Tax=Candidatus Poriferisocius sp. TaxID=3101276 RepID=UPI003B02BCD4
MNFGEKYRTELVYGLLSTALLTIVLVGIPILLIVGVGWPLPQSIPSITKVSAAFKTGTIPSALILKSISCILWILWLQILIGVGVELWSHFHGRLAPRVVFIPQFIQRFSSRIISTALVITFSVQNPGIATENNQELLDPTSIELDEDKLWSPSIENMNTSSSFKNKVDGINTSLDEELVEIKPLIHTVQQRDSLRVLAEQYLGDPNRWTEIFVLNHQRVQAVGGSLTDPARLQLGWELVMPADAHRLEETKSNEDIIIEKNNQTNSSSIKLSSTKVTVQEGDTLWNLANQYFNDPEKWVTIFNSNRDIIDDPNIIVPGWELTIPVDNYQSEVLLNPELPIEVSEELIKFTAPVMAYTEAKPVVVTNVPSTIELEKESTFNAQVAFIVGGLGIFTSSLIWFLARIRRNYTQHLSNKRIPILPTTETLQIEQQLETISEHDSAIFLDASLRILFSNNSPSPEIIGVNIDSNSVSILLSKPTKAPNGFIANEDNSIWKLSKNMTPKYLLKEAEGISPALPTLVTLGKGPNGEFLLNLEHTSTLNLKGDSQAIKDMCKAIAIQLASSHLADLLTVICVGFAQDLSEFERIICVDDVSSAIEKIIYQLRQNQAILGDDFLFDYTSTDNNKSHHPVVVLIPDKLTEGEARRFLEIYDPSISIVGHGLNDAIWTGKFDDSGLLLEPIGLKLEPHGLSDNAVTMIAEMVSSAKSTHDAVLETAPTQEEAEIEKSTSMLEQSLMNIEVRVLGTVDILGTLQPFASRRALDLVVYLAFHPEGADRDQLKTHIWPPDDPPSESTFSNTVSRARKALGVDSDGQPYLPRVNSKGIYQLRPEVETDVGQFETLIAAARSDTSEEGTKQLKKALQLVRGTPFTGGATNLYRWADFGLRTYIDCMVDTAAHELAERCIVSGDAEGARRAALTSLRLVGICEQCYYWRLRAATGNPTEARQVMAELVGLLRRESNKFEVNDLISPDLLQLYKRLTTSPTVLDPQDEREDVEEPPSYQLHAQTSYNQSPVQPIVDEEWVISEYPTHD